MAETTEARIWHLCQQAWNDNFKVTAPLLILAAYYFTKFAGWILFSITCICIFFFVSQQQQCKINFYYSNKEGFESLFQKTNLKQMSYKPSIYTLTTSCQTLWFGVVEALETLFPTIQYRRQVFKCRDGGQLALDWLVGHKSEEKIRDLVVCIPGLSGDSRELYSI